MTELEEKIDYLTYRAERYEEEAQIYIKQASIARAKLNNIDMDLKWTRKELAILKGGS